MTPEELLQRFEDLHPAGAHSGAGAVMCGLANWMSHRHRILTDDDVELLAIVGSALYGTATIECEGVVDTARRHAQSAIRKMRE